MGIKNDLQKKNILLKKNTLKNPKLKKIQRFKFLHRNMKFSTEKCH